MALKEIENKKEWTFLQESAYYSFEKERYVEMNGPHDLQLSIDDFKLTFWNPPYRYRQWFELQNKDGSDAIEQRNYWRQYMFQMVSLFGGDRVIYLADNGHPLEKYIDSECPFEEIEKELFTEFGKPSESLKEVSENDQRHYYIDRFQDLR